ncbi:carbohydrate-binding module family 50 protein [Laetiporus sulphureus 93-53]|uniref:Carbohydrate-binding module family 50 protein n=1 Tax=Laetiporus sulphureus 93-53 TaxID=1314785 RepID=A0A165B698_9APHY|nr:carbohydrate-binding module family 50 protein [Laetiporus sulphureus 93-53]KZT00336.1 carbohydrate-binding module family 50 protein [Laetiporus sulphureus 93-53]
MSILARSVVAALLAFSLVAHSANAQQCARTYTVQEGEDCDSISAAQNVSTYQLATVNSGEVDTDCSNLVPGEELCLGWVGSDCTDTYVVSDGDDCDIVAARYGINVTLLYENNPQLDASCDNMYIGEVLCVASAVDVPVAGSGSSSAVVSATAVVPSSAVVTSSIEVAQTSSAVATSSFVTITATVIATSTDSAGITTATTTGDDGDDGDSGDDDDYPWCDEL